MRKNSKKRLSLALALVMVIALLPTAAFAADSDFTIENGVLTWYTGPGGDVTIPDGVTGTDAGAFAGCTGLTSVTIPDSVTSIGSDTFAGCTGLTSVTIPGSVASIGDGAFFDCTGLKSVTISKGVTSIGDFAFQDCTGLTSVGMIPDSVTSIGEGAFICCFSLTEIQVDPENQVYASVDGVLLTKDLKTVVMCPCGKQGAYTIPDGVTGIGSSAFEECTELTSVTIPNSVTGIGTMAFFDCEHLKDVYYGGSKAQWEAVSIGSYDSALRSATIHYNSTGPEEPTTPETPATLPTVENIPATGTAVARTQNVLLDGKTVQFQYYAVKDAKGNESNYVKVRDLAQALNGTKAQFNVGWDSKISITSNTAYEAVGGEGSTPYAGDQPYAAVSTDAVSFNGSDVNLTSFRITYQGNGYTYL